MLWTPPDHLYKLMELNKDCRARYSSCSLERTFVAQALERFIKISVRNKNLSQEARGRILTKCLGELDWIQMSPIFWAHVMMDPERSMQLLCRMMGLYDRQIYDKHLIVKRIQRYKHKIIPAIIQAYECSTEDPDRAAIGWESCLVLLSASRNVESLAHCLQIVRDQKWRLPSSSCLTFAAAAGSLDMVKYLHANTPKSNSGLDLTLIAAVLSSLEVLQYLLDSQPDMPIEYLECAFLHACLAGNEAAGQLILLVPNYGKDITLPLDNFQKLVRCRCYALIFSLLDPKRKDVHQYVWHREWYVFKYAAMDGKLALVERILDIIGTMKSGALHPSRESPNWNYFVTTADWALQAALVNRREDVARVLIRRVPGVNIVLVTEFLEIPRDTVDAWLVGGGNRIGNR